MSEKTYFSSFYDRFYSQNECVFIMKKYEKNELCDEKEWFCNIFTFFTTKSKNRGFFPQCACFSHQKMVLKKRTFRLETMVFWYFYFFSQKKKIKVFIPNAHFVVPQKRANKKRALKLETRFFVFIFIFLTKK